jgi:hypothetical protein
MYLKLKSLGVALYALSVGLCTLIGLIIAGKSVWVGLKPENRGRKL